MSNFKTYFASVEDEKIVRIILLQIAHAVHDVHQKFSHRKLNVENLLVSKSKIELVQPNKIVANSEKRKKRENQGMRSDIRDLGKLFEKLLDEKELFDNIVEHLCKQMTKTYDDDINFTSKEVLQHPYFWSTLKKLRFIKAAAQRITKENESENKELLRRLERSETVFNARNGWFTELAMTDETVQESSIVKFAADLENGKYNEKHLWSLVQFIGHHWNDCNENDDQAQASETYWQLFNQRFPNLLTAVYDAARDTCKYFDQDSTRFNGFMSLFKPYLEEIAPNEDIPPVTGYTLFAYHIVTFCIRAYICHGVAFG